MYPLNKRHKMRIILASNNKGKIEEFKKLLPKVSIIPFGEILGDFEIIEDGLTFQENAIKKAKEVYEKLNDDSCIVISDDSGISVPALNGEPGIYSARYSKEGTDSSNNNKLIKNLKEKDLNNTAAYYTACIAIVYKNEVYTVHSWMHGKIITEARGEGGFGYDPMFIPRNYDKTLAQLPYEVKKTLSHRSKALHLALKIIDLLL